MRVDFLNEGSDCHFSSMMTPHFLNISVSSLEIRFVGPEGDRTAWWEMLTCREVIFFNSSGIFSMTLWADNGNVDILTFIAMRLRECTNNAVCGVRCPSREVQSLCFGEERVPCRS